MTIDEAHLFVDECKVTPEVATYLTESGVNVHSYERALPFIESLGQSLAAEPDIPSPDGIVAPTKRKIWFDGKSVNFAVYRCVGATTVYEGPTVAAFPASF
jgi:hypothetical protein